MPQGYHGKILVVDLTARSWKDVSLPEDIYRKYFGGYGLGAYYIYTHIKPRCDPLGPKNILGFCPGLLTGSPAPLTGRYMVCAKSPLTGKGLRKNGTSSNGGWGNANSGGFFGPALKRTGYDAVFFEGQASSPVYLLINGETIELRDANDLWGTDTVETEKVLRGIHGSQFQVASIGQAGENLSLISGIVNDQGRIAARSGLGAVMGSKKLKALCVHGSVKLTYASKNEMNAHIKTYLTRLKKALKPGLMTKVIPSADRLAGLMRVLKIPMGGNSKSAPDIMLQVFGPSRMGTTTGNVISSQNGDTPIKNLKGVGYKDFPLKRALHIRGKSLRDHMKRPYGCFGCPVRCGAILEYPDLPYDDKLTHRPEYETSAAFGSLILNDNLDVIIQANEYLNRVGMDSISAGMTLAYVLECCEMGILTQVDFRCQDYPEGFLPTWGESAYILPLLKLMVTREGIGDKLADGTYEAALRIPKSQAFAMHVNGQEIPMHDPRLDANLALTYVTDPTPARHTAASLLFEIGKAGKYFLPEAKFEIPSDPYQRGVAQAKVAKFHQTIETLGFCLFAVNYGKYPYLEVIKSAFGWEIDVEELFSIGHRIQTLRQMFNAREGAIMHDFPNRALGNPPLTKGPLKKISLALEPYISGYYNAMGFQNDGIPSKSLLRKLDLEYCAKDLALDTTTGDTSYLNSDSEHPIEGKPPSILPLRGG